MQKCLYVRCFAMGIFLLTGFLSRSQAPAQPTGPLGIDPPDGVTELIVRLKAGPGQPTPESVVDAFANDEMPPSGLGEGNPSHGRLLLRRRAAGRELAWNQANPGSASARLQRYVVLGGYPNGNLRAIGNALSNNPHVEVVNYNLFLTLSAVPNDPFFGVTGQSPLVSQWGLHLMNFPAAWDLVKGHAYVGVIDNGIASAHIDLAALDSNGTYIGGNWRSHLSIDFKIKDENGNDVLGGFDCTADEVTDGTNPPDFLGHGAHVSGILAAHAGNGEGVASACWQCSLLMMKATDQETLRMFVSDVAAAMDFLINNSAQIVNLSAGFANARCPPDNPTRLDVSAICDQIERMEQNNILTVAAAGNNQQSSIHFPAVQPEVLAVGGVDFSTTQPEGYAFWPESNYGPDLDLVGPVATLSTMYPQHDWLPGVCGDSVGGIGTSFDGYGYCRGTSVASPHVAGCAALVRSTNPLLSNAVIRDIIIASSSRATNWDPQLGYGFPDAEMAVKKSLGLVGGVPLPNRLTPLFGFRRTIQQSGQIQTHAATTVPSFANSLLSIFYNTEGIKVPGYDDFPGPPCDPQQGQDCPAELTPRAISYVFTTSTPPYTGSPPLVPLYRLTRDSQRSTECNDQPNSIEHFSYATNIQDILYLTAPDRGYALDGIEGFVFQSCNTSCAETGAVPLRLLYNSNNQDFLLTTEEIAPPGYEPPADSGLALPEIIAFSYPVIDTDNDHLIDGFEKLAGTAPAGFDSDCDGVSDGTELLNYDLSDLNPQNHGYTDPLLGSCLLIFEDGFESGNTFNWSLSQGIQ